jgi:hypothetical protein
MVLSVVWCLSGGNAHYKVMHGELTSLSFLLHGYQVGADLELSWELTMLSSYPRSGFSFLNSDNNNF